MSQTSSISEFASAPEGLGSLWRMHQRDARATDDFLSQVSARLGNAKEPFLTATITSPPYANLVDYGEDGQIGFGQSFDEYLSELRAIFESLHRWTKNDGALWLVVDSVTQKGEGTQPGRMIPLPFVLSELATQSGWSLRDVVIWRKDRTRPWSSKGRLRNGFEYVLFLVKSTEYQYHVERLRDLRGLKTWWVKYPERHNPWGMAPDNVWDIPIPVQGSWATSELRHACPLPEELIARIVKLSTQEGDIVFDPFAGSGMVLATAEAENRLSLGTELNPRFIEAYQENVRPRVLSALRPDLDFELGDFTGKLLTLRVLKYPKDLIKQVLLGGISRSSILGAVVAAEAFDTTPRTSKYAVAAVHLVVPDDIGDETVAAIEHAAARAASKPPLSKYGLEVRVVVTALAELPTKLEADRYAVYLRGKTWAASRFVTREAADEVLRASDNGAFPPVLSPLTANEIPSDY